MSGMCEKSAFDTFYHMDNDEKGLVTYYGFDSSMIQYDTKERLWILTIEHKPGVMASQSGRCWSKKLEICTRKNFVTLYFVANARFVAIHALFERFSLNIEQKVASVKIAFVKNDIFVANLQICARFLSGIAIRQTKGRGVYLRLLKVRQPLPATLWLHVNQNLPALCSATMIGR